MMDPIEELRPAEEELVAAARRGLPYPEAPADPEPRSEDEPVPEIRAEVLRRLILGLPPIDSPGDGSRDAVGPQRLGSRRVEEVAHYLPRGVHLRRIRIEGELDLSDATGPEGSPLPALVFLSCEFPDRVLLDNARLSRVSFAGSRLTQVRARALRSQGLVDFSKVMPHVSPASVEEGRQAVCQIDLAGAQLDAGFRAVGARLVAEKRGENRPVDPAAGDTRYALDLKEATVRGDVHLQPDFEAEGGVTLSGAHVRGDVWARGARLVAGEGNAFRGDGIRVDGSISFGANVDTRNGRITRFFARGREAEAPDEPAAYTAGVWLWGARISDTLQMSGADVEGRVALIGASIGGDLDLSRSYSDSSNSRAVTLTAGDLALHRASIGGSLNLEGAEIEADVAVPEARIGKSFHFGSSGEGSICGGGIYLTGVEVGGDVVVNGTAADPASSGGGAHHAKALILDDATIGGSVSVLGVDIAGPVQAQRTRIEKNFQAGTQAHPVSCAAPVDGGDALDVNSAAVGGDFQVIGSGESPTTFDGGVDLRMASIDGQLYLGGVRVHGTLEARSVTITKDAYLGDRALNRFLECDGVVLLGGASVGGQLSLQNGTCSGLKAPSLTVGGSCEVDACEFRDPVRLDHARIGGSLEIRRSKLIRTSSLEGAEIRGDLILQGVQLGPDGDPGGEADHVFRGMTIGGELEVAGLSAHRSAPPDPFGGAARFAPAPGESWSFRTRELSCYPGWSVVEAVSALEPGEGTDESRNYGVLSFLWRDDSSDGTARIWPLTGASNPIHAFNSQRPPDLSDQKGAEDYLRFFCGCLWGDEGPFRIVASASDLPWIDEASAASADIRPPEVELLGSLLKREGAEATATVLYADHLFQARFQLHPGGMVEMLEDEPIARLEDHEKIPERLAAPARLWQGSGPLSALPALLGEGWTSVPGAGDEQERLDRALRSAIFGDPAPTRTEPTSNPVIDLTATSVSSLNDLDGDGWGTDFRFKLDGFHYARAPKVYRKVGMDPWSSSSATSRPVALGQGPTARRPGGDGERGVGSRWLAGPFHWLRRAFGRRRPHGRVERRRQWLALQHEPPEKSEKENYRPHPYEMLAAALQDEGAFDEAREILSHKLTLETRHRSLGERMFWKPYGWFFKFGLSPKRAFLTCVAFWLAGWLGTSYANASDLLVVNYTPASTMVTAAQSRPAANLRFAVAPEDPNTGEAPTEVPCGDMIFEGIYALDAMIPLLDLGQESVCVIRGAGQRYGGRLAPSGVRALAGAVVSWARSPSRWDRLRDGIRSPNLWAFGRMLYSVFGAVVVSLAILTWSGLARRHVEA